MVSLRTQKPLPQRFDSRTGSPPAQRSPCGTVTLCDRGPRRRRRRRRHSCLLPRRRSRPRRGDRAAPPRARPLITDHPDSSSATNGGGRPLPRRQPSHVYVGARVWHRDDELVVQLDDTHARARVTRDAAWIGGLQRRPRPRVPAALSLHRDPPARPPSSLRAARRGARRDERRCVRRARLRPARASRPSRSPRSLSGWRLLSDDLVVIRQGPFGPEASGIARRVALPGDLGAVLEVPTPTIVGDHRGRREFSVENLSPGWFPVAGIIEVGHSSSPGGELQTRLR